MLTCAGTDVHSSVSKLYGFGVGLESEHDFSQLVAQPQSGRRAADLHCNGQSTVLRGEEHRHRSALKVYFQSGPSGLFIIIMPFFRYDSFQMTLSICTFAVHVDVVNLKSLENVVWFMP